MKILHVIPSVSLVRGGPSQAVLEMVWALRQQGVDAEIATTNDDVNDCLDVPLGKLIDYPISSHSQHSTMPIRTVPIRFFSRFSPKSKAIREFACSFTLSAWLWQNVKAYNCLHIHAIFSYTTPMAMAIARTQKIPYIVRPLGALCHWSLKQGQAKKQHYLRLIKPYLQKAQAIHFTSEQERQEAESLGLKANSFTLAHGLDLPLLLTDAPKQLRLRLNLPMNQPIILFLSRIHHKKGLEPLIAALESIAAYPFQFVIAGRGEADYESQIQSRIANSVLVDRTHFVGFATGAEKQCLLQGADLFVLPSHSENFGIAVLEAMAAGLPSLITPNVGLAPVIEQHQLGWVVPQEIETTSDALIAFFQQSPQHRQIMKQKARCLVESQFTWSQIAQQLIVQYAQSSQTTQMELNYA
jgi:glycosyltransferase involved in cell wall biosynthesis